MADSKPMQQQGAQGVLQQALQQAGPQKPPATPPPPPGTLSAAEVIQHVKSSLMQKYRDPSFVVPISMNEPPVAMQLPGLAEPQAPTAQPFPSLGPAGMASGGAPAPFSEALPGLHTGSAGALPSPPLGTGMGGQEAAQAVNPVQPAQSEQSPNQFKPSDALLI